jgi:hypothetical protein
LIHPSAEASSYVVCLADIERSELICDPARISRLNANARMPAPTATRSCSSPGESENHHKAIYSAAARGEGAIRQLPMSLPCGGPLGEAHQYGCYPHRSMAAR